LGWVVGGGGYMEDCFGEGGGGVGGGGRSMVVEFGVVKLLRGG